MKQQDFLKPSEKYVYYERLTEVVICCLHLFQDKNE